MGKGQKDQTGPPSILDVLHLESFTAGDQALEKELYGIFHGQSLLSLEKLRQACDCGDDEAWRLFAHRFKGSAANIGAKALAEICRQAEYGYQENKSVKRAWLNEMASQCSTIQVFFEQKRLRQ